jgi:hypothetical protein
MKIEIELPDWVEDNPSILIQANGELVAFQHHDGTLKVKQKRCDQCGECCLDVGGAGPYGSDDEGKCSKLIKEGDKWMCAAWKQITGPKPYRCVFDPDNLEGCCVTYG